MKLKNYMKEGQKLPLFGIGPYLIYGIGLLTAVCIVLFVYVFRREGPEIYFHSIHILLEISRALETRE